HARPENCGKLGDGGGAGARVRAGVNMRDDACAGNRERERPVAGSGERGKKESLIGHTPPPAAYSRVPLSLPTPGSGASESGDRAPSSPRVAA
ncbi:unnamed protein product, partial [Discosporangium mesarthrocarpum]